MVTPSESPLLVSLKQQTSLFSTCNYTSLYMRSSSWDFQIWVGNSTSPTEDEVTQKYWTWMLVMSIMGLTLHRKAQNVEKSGLVGFRVCRGGLRCFRFLLTYWKRKKVSTPLQFAASNRGTLDKVYQNIPIYFCSCKREKMELQPSVTRGLEHVLPLLQRAYSWQQSEGRPQRLGSQMGKVYCSWPVFSWSSLLPAPRAAAISFFSSALLCLSMSSISRSFCKKSREKGWESQKFTSSQNVELSCKDFFQQ